MSVPAPYMNPGLMYQNPALMYQNPALQPNDPTGGNTIDPNSILATLGTGANLAGNLYGLYQGAHLQGAASDVFKQSDPFASYRPGYGAQLLKLMQDPSSVTSLPGYQFLMSQGTDAINRSAAGPGGVGFGSTADKAQLMQYGQGLADKFYQEQVATLSQLAGAQFPPANPYNALQGLGGAQNIMGGATTGAINSTAQLLSKLFPNLASSGAGVTAADLAGYNAGIANAFATDPNLAVSGLDLTGLFAGPSAAGGGAAAAAGAGAAPAGSVIVGLPGDYTGAAAAGGAVADVGSAQATSNAAFDAYSASAGADAASGGTAAAGGGLSSALLAAAGPLAFAGLMGYAMSTPPYTTTKAYNDRVLGGYQQTLSGGPKGYGSPYNTTLLQLGQDNRAGRIQQWQWDALRQYGITPGNLEALILQSNAMGPYTGPGSSIPQGGGGRVL